MNTYQMREEMIRSFMKETMNVNVESVYVSSVVDETIMIECYDEGCSWNDSLQTSLVMAWIWSKIV